MSSSLNVFRNLPPCGLIMALFFSIVAGPGRLVLPQIAKRLDDYSANARSGIVKKPWSLRIQVNWLIILSCNA